METSNGVKKFIILSAAIFLLASGCAKIQPQAVYQQVSQPIPQIATTAPKSNYQAVSAGKTQSDKNSESSDNFPGTVHPVPKIPPVVTITATQTVDGSSLNKAFDVIAAGENAVDLLRLDHKITTQNYSGIGEFVQSIDGIGPDSKHYWEFFVNGKSSNVGASSYILKAGDNIEWKLSAINSSGE
jgi:hypothetical protein